MSQIKSMSKSDDVHIMPCPSSTPWDARAMPWASTTGIPEVVEFNALKFSESEMEKMPSSCKRKSDISVPVPPKLLITEEKMAAHLSGLHISSDYVSHDINNACDNLEEASMLDSDTSPYTISVSPEELKEKLMNANRISICDEVKMLNNEDNSVIPKALLSRIEKPCTALVLWKPVPFSHNYPIIKDEDIRNDDQQNNNDLMETEML